MTREELIGVNAGIVKSVASEHPEIFSECNYRSYL